VDGQAVEPVGRHGGRPTVGAAGGAGDRDGDRRAGRGLLGSGLVELVLGDVGDRRGGGGDAGLVLLPGLLLAVAAFAGAGVEGLQLGGAVGAGRGLARLAPGACRGVDCGGGPGELDACGRGVQRSAGWLGAPAQGRVRRERARQQGLGRAGTGYRSDADGGAVVTAAAATCRTQQQRCGDRG